MEHTDQHQPLPEVLRNDAEKPVESEEEEPYQRVAGTKVSVRDLTELGTSLAAQMGSLKRAIHDPRNEKVAPSFNAAQVAAMCGKQPSAFARQLQSAAKKGLPTGIVTGADGRQKSQRQFSLEEAVQWVSAVGGKTYKRKPGQKGAVITVGFYKGGVGKTLVAASVAQALALNGYRVLAIDLDPQGHLSVMLGLELQNVQYEDTFAPLTAMPGEEGARESLIESVRPTYWTNLDIVAGGNALHEGEFFIPLRAMRAQEQKKSFNFLEILSNGLDFGLRDEYDYIVIDTPPQMGYQVMNAYWAADAILMPVVPEGLSLQSSVQFWDQFSQLVQVAQMRSRKPKEYAWLGVVPSKVEHHKTSVQGMLTWMRMFYGEYVLGSELPLTEAVKQAGTEFNTVYDISKYVGSAKTYERARTAFDRLVSEIDLLTRQRLWNEDSREN